MTEISTLTKRRLQAQVIKPIYEEMEQVLGAEKAQQILADAIRKASVAEAREFAEKAPGKKTDMASFISLYDLWSQDGALEVEIIEESTDRYDFDVTRCRFAEMYHEMGLGHIGHLLSCHRDGTFCEGYDPAISLEREQTIMQGNERCTFRYRYKAPEDAS
jgi:hypothetical protein